MEILIPFGVILLSIIGFCVCITAGKACKVVEHIGNDLIRESQKSQQIANEIMNQIRQNPITVDQIKQNPRIVIGQSIESLPPEVQEFILENSNMSDQYFEDWMRKLHRSK